MTQNRKGRIAEMRRPFWWNIGGMYDLDLE